MKNNPVAGKVLIALWSDHMAAGQAMGMLNHLHTTESDA